jgi:hypothetical protein
VWRGRWEGCCCVGLFDGQHWGVVYIIFALQALKSSACHEYKIVDVYKIDEQRLRCHCTSRQGTFLFIQAYKRLRISSTTSVVVAVPPKSGLRSLPASKFPSTAA